MRDRDNQQASRPVTKLGGMNLLGLFVFLVWIMMGVCFSLGFAVAEPILRCFLVVVVLVWSVLGPFALSFCLVETATLLAQKGFHKMALKLAEIGTSVDGMILPMVNLFGMIDSPLAILNLLNQACALMCLTRFKEASVVLESAVDKSQGALGWDHNLTQIVVGQLANCLVYLGRFSEAEKFYRRGIAAKTSGIRPNDIDLAETILPAIAALTMDRYGFGSLLEKQLKFEQAENQYLLAIETIDKYICDDTDFLANILNALGELYLKTYRLDDAEKYISRAHNIRKEIFPARHIVLASSYHALGSLRLKQGNFYESKRFLSDALSIKEKFLGIGHPDVAETYRVFGELEMALENYHKSDEYLCRALAILEETFGVYPDVACVLESLSALHQKTGESIKCQQYAERAAFIRNSIA